MSRYEFLSDKELMDQFQCSSHLLMLIMGAKEYGNYIENQCTPEDKIGTTLALLDNAIEYAQQMVSESNREVLKRLPNGKDFE